MESNRLTTRSPPLVSSPLFRERSMPIGPAPDFEFKAAAVEVVAAEAEVAEVVVAAGVAAAVEAAEVEVEAEVPGQVAAHSRGLPARMDRGCYRRGQRK